MQPHERKNGLANNLTNFVPPGDSKELPRLAFSIAEVALMLGLSEKTIHRLIQRGLLRPLRATRHIRITRSELERFLNEDVLRM
jgi:excisionase family DNA binding protein